MTSGENFLINSLVSKGYSGNWLVVVALATVDKLHHHSVHSNDSKIHMTRT